MDEKKISLEKEILDKVIGKVSLSQPPEVKEGIILSALKEICDGLHSGGTECEKRYFGDEKSKTDFFKELQGYGVIDPLLNDPSVEDIIVNGTEPIYAHHAKDGLIKTQQRFFSLEELDLLIRKLLVFSGRTELKKINNIDLLGMRGRINIIYSPFGPELTIAKVKANPFSVIELIENKTLNAEIASLLWLYVEGMGVRPANMLISGGPGSGKTTLLNSLLSFIPSDHHIVVIEDTFELVTSWIGNVSRLESDDDLSLADLVKNSLRMRPERIIVGEVRGEEAQDMVTAMNIGKYCMATLHASTVRETIIRLQSNPMNVPETLINLIDAFVVMRKQKDGRSMARMVDEVSETAGLEQKTVLLSPLWKFDTSTGRLNKLSPTSVYRDRLSKATGRSGREILDEIDRRRDFLEVLRRNGVSAIKDVSRYCELYLKDARQALAELKK